jgi:hypothetical protein
VTPLDAAPTNAATNAATDSRRAVRLGCGECQADGASRVSLECAMHRAGVAHEIRAGPRESRKKLERQQITFQSVTGRTGDDHIPGVVRATARERNDMVESRRVLIESAGAVYTPLSAVS